MREILSICIPTYNRSRYLGELLRSLQKAVTRLGDPAAIRIHISDNASTDDTRAVVDAFAGPLPIVYHRNPENVGGDRNFAKVIDRSSGEYFWLLGDDELVEEDALVELMPVLAAGRHALVILRSDGSVGPKGTAPVARPAEFASYRALVEAFAGSNPWMMMEHSLISYNVIRRAAFSRAEQDRIFETQDIHYAHMYALVEGLERAGGPVLMPAFRALVIRPQRAEVGVNYLLVRRLCRRYYEWLAVRYGRPELARYGRKLYGPSKQFRAFRQRLRASITAWFSSPKPRASAG